MFHHVKGLVVVALSALFMFGCSSTEERGAAEEFGANTGRVIDDSVITGKVKAALIADSVTKAHQIDVETYQGTVQLSGFVDDAEAIDRATEIARETEGVKDVNNELEVRTSG